jgi:hypothetical protein
MDSEKTSTNDAVSKPALILLIAIFLIIIGGLLVFSNLLMSAVDVRALAIGFELQIIGIGLIAVEKYKK